MNKHSCCFFFVVLTGIVYLFFNHFQQTNNNTEKEKHTRALIRQTARWTVASQQDTSPMIALLHANYAAGYLQALELIRSEQEINHVTNLQALRHKVYDTQDNAARAVVTSCPAYLGKNIDQELARMGINAS